MNPHPDHTLIEIGRKIREAKSIIDEHNRAATEAYNLYNAARPRVPEAMFAREGEVRFLPGATATSEREPGETRKYYWLNVREKLVAAIADAAPERREETANRKWITVENVMRSAERATEILAALDEYNSRCMAVAKEVGYPLTREQEIEADAASEEAYSSLINLTTEAVSTPALTLVGLRIKLYAAEACLGSEWIDVEAEIGKKHISDVALFSFAKSAEAFLPTLEEALAASTQVAA